VAVMDKVKTICRQSTNLPLEDLLHRLNRMLRGLDRVLQVRLLTCDLQLPEVLPVEASHQVARAQASAHPMERGCVDASAAGPPTVRWNCSTPPG
jgi:hypothetical protein